MKDFKAQGLRLASLALIISTFSSILLLGSAHSDSEITGQEVGSSTCASRFDGFQNPYVMTPKERHLAINGIKQAIAKDPQNPELYIELAECYLASSFWHYAVDALKKAIALDPSQDRARFRLGKAYLDRGIDEWQARWFAQAIDEFSRIPTTSPFYKESRRYLAQSYLDIGKGDSAIAAFGTLDRSRMGADDLLVLGLCFWQTQEFDSASFAFREAIRLMDQDQVQRYLFPFFSSKKPQIVDTSDVFILAERFWRKQDPNPATPVNERLVEHIARVAFADFHFSVPKLGTSGSMTTRGEVLIRYGFPKKWYFDPFGTGIVADEACLPVCYGDRSHYEDSRTVKDFASASDIDKPSWIWDYDTFTLTFFDNFLNSDYDFAYTTSDAEKYAILTNRVSDFYKLAFKEETRVIVDAINLLDNDGKPAIKINYATDSRVTQSKSRRLAEAKLLVQAAILDTSYNQIEYRRSVELIRADSSVAPITPFPLISSLFFRSHKDARLVAISVESLENKAKGYATCAFMPRRLEDDLSVSDIEVRFTPSGPPNPSHAFRMDGKAYFRFQIYNASTDTSGAAEVNLDFRLERKENERGSFARLLGKLARRGKQQMIASFSTSYPLRAIGSRIDHTLGLDLSKMEEGQYKFTLEVRDRKTARSTKSETDILVLPQ